jgi:hypothetical protein
LKKENPTRIDEKSGGKILNAFPDIQSRQPFRNPRPVTKDTKTRRFYTAFQMNMAKSGIAV